MSPAFGNIRDQMDELLDHIEAVHDNIQRIEAPDDSPLKVRGQTLERAYDDIAATLGRPNFKEHKERDP